MTKFIDAYMRRQGSMKSKKVGDECLSLCEAIY